MFDAVIALLQRQWDNQVFAGGLALGVFGAVTAMLTRVAWAGFRLLVARLLPSLTIEQRSPLFNYIQAWLHDHPYTRRCRVLVAAPIPNNPNTDNSVWLVPGEGSHLLRQGRTWFWLHRSREVPSTGRQSRERESLRIQALSVRRAAITHLVASILRSHGHRAGTIALHAVASYGEWSELGRIAYRPLATVIVPDGISRLLLEDARRFLAAKDWYGARGVPWRRGYLFYGPPGTGKTSLVRALASELEIDLALLDLSQPNLDDANLRELLGHLPANAALVLEDVDSVTPGRDETDRKLTLSGVLNALDGLAAPEGRLLFMTTNHLERLDPALVRPGRVDRAVEIGPLTAAEAQHMVALFHPDRPDVAAAVAEALGQSHITAARLQGLLLSHAGDPEQVALKVVATARSPEETRAGGS